jgi:hypothetical protein
VLEFEQQSIEKISDTLKIAIILEHFPTRIAEGLRLSGPDVRDNCPAMRDAMRCLSESTREYPTTHTSVAGTNGNDSVPMDVSAVLYGTWNKGNGKKGKAKTWQRRQGRQERQWQAFPWRGECGNCGKWGHMRTDCRAKTYDEKGNGQGC